MHAGVVCLLLLLLLLLCLLLCLLLRLSLRLLHPFVVNPLEFVQLFHGDDIRVPGRPFFELAPQPDVVRDVDAVILDALGDDRWEWSLVHSLYDLRIQGRPTLLLLLPSKKFLLKPLLHLRGIYHPSHLLILLQKVPSHSHRGTRLSSLQRLWVHLLTRLGNVCIVRPSLFLLHPSRQHQAELFLRQFHHLLSYRYGHICGYLASSGSLRSSRHLGLCRGGSLLRHLDRLRCIDSGTQVLRHLLAGLLLSRLRGGAPLLARRNHWSCQHRHRSILRLTRTHVEAAHLVTKSHLLCLRLGDSLATCLRCLGLCLSRLHLSNRILSLCLLLQVERWLLPGVSILPRWHSLSVNLPRLSATHRIEPGHLVYVGVVACRHDIVSGLSRAHSIGLLVRKLSKVEVSIPRDTALLRLHISHLRGPLHHSLARRPTSHALVLLLTKLTALPYWLALLHIHDHHMRPIPAMQHERVETSCFQQLSSLERKLRNLGPNPILIFGCKSLS